MTMPFFINPATNPSVQREYSKYRARRAASEAAQRNAQAGPQRRLGLVDEKDKEKAMRAAHERVSQIAEDNWSFLDEHMGGFMSLPGRARLQLYHSHDPWFLDYMPYPVQVGKQNQRGEIEYVTQFLPGTPNPWLLTLLSINTLHTLPLLDDYQKLIKTYEDVLA